MPSETTINANLVLKATEPDLQKEHIDETFWDALAVDNALETDYDGPAPESVITRKTELVKVGAKYIEFGMTKELEGEGRFNGQTLVGFEEPMETEDNAVYFTDARHGVPFPIKFLESHYNRAFPLMQRRQHALSVWNGRISEEWAWQAFIKGCPDKVYTKHTTASPQSYHPTIYTIDAAGTTRVTWNATPATYEASLDAALFAQASGDNVDLDRIYEAEVLAANHKLRKIPISIDGKTEMLYLWVYPRAARVRIKQALDDNWLSGDVRGPSNKAFNGTKFKYGQFLFVEAAHIPYLHSVDDDTVQYQGAWAYDSDLNKRKDYRTTSLGLVHAILGADALCLAEPEKLQYDFDRQDYKAREGMGTYRLFGYRRNETFDDRTSIASVTNQSSIVLLEYNG